MTRFNARAQLPVREPFRFDLTVDALRRLAANVVDVLDEDGTYLRLLHYYERVVPLRIEMEDGRPIVATSKRADLEFCIATASRVFGTTADLTRWYERTRRVQWLAPLAGALRGLKPPRYPSLFEACAHAIIFQQISIHAAASVMRRFVQALSSAETIAGAYAFPTPAMVEAADVELLRRCGLSLPKISHLKSAASAVRTGAIAEAEIERLSTADAAVYLTQVRGIGPWSAAVVLLRGFGRLDTFPLKDSGVARSLKLLSGNPEIDVDALLDTLGDVRGMLYYHLLLGRLRNLLPGTYG